MLSSLIDVPTLGPLINTAPPQPDESAAASQSLLDAIQEPLASMDTQEDLMVFTPPSSPTYSHSLPVSPTMIQGCAVDPIVRPATANPVGREAVVVQGMRNGAVDHEAMLFRDPLHKYEYPPPMNGGSAPPPRQNRAAEFEPLPSLSAMLARPVDIPAPRPGPPPSPVITFSGCNVVITNLPGDVTPHFVLQRIRGGNVSNCCLTKFKGKGMAGEETIAVVTFEAPRAAEQYVELLRGEQAPGVWKWSTAAGGNVTAEVKRYAQLPRAPHTDLASIPLEQPKLWKLVPPSRCLVVAPCASEKLETIWTDLDLPRLLSLQHYRAQVEDVWFDGYERDELGAVVSGALHIRFTSTRMAVDTKNRVSRKPWAVVRPGRPWSAEDPLQFEADPCSLGLATLGEGLIGSHEGYEYLRKDHLPLLELSDMGKLSRVLQDWRARDAAAKGRGRPAAAAPVQAAAGPPPVGSRGLAPFEVILTARRRDRALERGTNDGSSRSPALGDHQSQRLPPSSQDYLEDAPSNIRAQIAAFLSTPPSPSVLGGPALPGSTVEDDNDRNYDADDEMDTKEFEPEPEPVPEAPKYPNYSRQAWGPGSGATTYHWRVSMAEYRAMSEEQWKAFGTCFYVPPEGFNTPQTATARRVLTHWD